MSNKNSFKISLSKMTNFSHCFPPIIFSYSVALLFFTLFYLMMVF